MPATLFGVPQFGEREKWIDPNLGISVNAVTKNVSEERSYQEGEFLFMSIGRLKIR